MQTTATEALRLAYDEVPYPMLSYAHTHPDTLATIAKLAGMSPAPIENCRVLELGCAGGGNLLPMADALPDSRFVGIDLSSRQIDEGQAVVDEIGLKNITLKQMSILDVEPDFGQFDYIITHGVFSWVPPDVQDKILSICKHNLSPHGVAYISYNVYPGWKFFGAIRDMLLYRTRDFAEPRQRALQAREFLNFISQSLASSDTAHSVILNAYAMFLQQELERVKEAGDAYLLHDELETINEPLYFHDFARRAERHGLQYLADADFRTGMGQQFSEETALKLRQLSRDTTDLEQYTDFLVNRMFRRSLLCHETLTLRRNLTPENATEFYFTSRADAESGESGVISFKGDDGSMYATNHPVAKTALMILRQQWPRALAFDELLDTSRARIANHPFTREQDALALGASLLKAFSLSRSLTEFHLFAPSLVTRAGDKPVAVRLARYQTQQMEKVTNLYHERVQLGRLAAHVLPLLDGTRDSEMLIEGLLAGPVARGALVIREKEQVVAEPNEQRRILRDELESCMEWLAFAALLTA